MKKNIDGYAEYYWRRRGIDPTTIHKGQSGEFEDDDGGLEEEDEEA